MSISNQLIRRIESKGFKVKELSRNRRGRYSKSAGVWAWVGTLNNGVIIGSTDTMGDCVKSPDFKYFIHDDGAIEFSAEFPLTSNEGVNK